MLHDLVRVGAFVSSRRRSQLVRIQKAVVVGIQNVEHSRHRAPVAFQCFRCAAAHAGRQLIGGKHTVAIAIHRMEAPAHVLLILGERYPPVTIRIEASQVVRACLCRCRTEWHERRNRSQQQ